MRLHLFFFFFFFFFRSFFISKTVPPSNPNPHKRLVAGEQCAREKYVCCARSLHCYCFAMGGAVRGALVRRGPSVVHQSDPSWCVFARRHPREVNWGQRTNAWERKSAISIARSLRVRCATSTMTMLLPERPRRCTPQVRCATACAPHPLSLLAHRPVCDNSDRAHPQARLAVDDTQRRPVFSRRDWCRQLFAGGRQPKPSRCYAGERDEGRGILRLYRRAQLTPCPHSSSTTPRSQWKHVRVARLRGLIRRRWTSNATLTTSPTENFFYAPLKSGSRDYTLAQQGQQQQRSFTFAFQADPVTADNSALTCSLQPFSTMAASYQQLWRQSTRKPEKPKLMLVCAEVDTSTGSFLKPKATVLPEAVGFEMVDGFNEDEDIDWSRSPLLLSVSYKDCSQLKADSVRDDHRGITEFTAVIAVPVRCNPNWVLSPKLQKGPFSCASDPVEWIPIMLERTQWSTVLRATMPDHGIGALRAGDLDADEPTWTAGKQNWAVLHFEQATSFDVEHYCKAPRDGGAQLLLGPDFGVFATFFGWVWWVGGGVEKLIVRKRIDRLTIPHTHSMSQGNFAYVKDTGFGTIPLTCDDRCLPDEFPARPDEDNGLKINNVGSTTNNSVGRALPAVMLLIGIASVAFIF